MPHSLALVLALVAVPPVAAAPSWQTTATQTKALRAFDNMARFCTSMGFTHLQRQDDEVMRGKFEAYLLLQPNPNPVMGRWAEMLNGFTQMQSAAKDETLTNRLSDALVAALKDPDAYEAAEKLYVETMMRPVERALAACEQAARDEFVGKWFISGRGSTAMFEDKVRKQFGQNVADLRANHK